MHQPHARSFVLATSLLAAAATAQATGLVEAIAAGASDSQNGPAAVSASAADAGFTAIATRTQGSTSVLIAGEPFTALRHPARARSSSDFTVLGLDTLVPLTFTWEFSASRSWSAENASVGTAMSVSLVTPAFIDIVGWGISYVDGPVALGNFAGTLENSFGVTAAGSGFNNGLPAGLWDGQGTRIATLTMEGALSGATGSFGLDVDGSMVGDVTATHQIRLLGLSVPAGTVLPAGGAWLLLDDGSMLPITAVPEPQRWALFAGGLAWVGLRLRRR